MLSKVDFEDIMEQFQRNIPTEQIVREYDISNPPMLEQYCSDLPEVDQLPMLKTLVRFESGRIACVGIETWNEFVWFVGVIECCRKHGWLDGEEVNTIVFELGRWCDGKRDGEDWKVEEAELALMRVAGGLSHRMF